MAGTTVILIWEMKKVSRRSFETSLRSYNKMVAATLLNQTKWRYPRLWRREQLPTPIFWPGEFHGQRRLVGYSLWGCRVGHDHVRASLMAQVVKNLPAMRETQVQSLGREDPLEKGMATHSSILARRILRTEEPGRLSFLGSQRVRHTFFPTLNN